MIDVNLAPTPAAVSAGEGMREAIARGFYERWVASESDKDAFDWSELPAALKARWYSFADTFSSGPDRQRLVSSAPVGFCPALADRGGTSATVSRGGHADTEGEAMEMFAHLNCPSCGGSGHVDDTRDAAGVDGVASVVAPPAASSGEGIQYSERVEYEQRILAAEMQAERLKRVLKPFADKADKWEANHAHSGRNSTQVQHRLGDFRAARTVLEEARDEG